MSYKYLRHYVGELISDQSDVAIHSNNMYTLLINLKQQVPVEIAPQGDHSHSFSKCTYFCWSWYAARFVIKRLYIIDRGHSHTDSLHHMVTLVP